MNERLRTAQGTLDVFKEQYARELGEGNETLRAVATHLELCAQLERLCIAQQNELSFYRKIGSLVTSANNAALRWADADAAMKLAKKERERE